MFFVDKYKMSYVLVRNSAAQIQGALLTDKSNLWIKYISILRL